MDREAVLELVAKRDAIDREIDALRDVLNSQKVGMDAPLVDSEGFPRNDVDVPQIRETRVKIIRLENDRKDLMEKIRVGLETVFKVDESSAGKSVKPVVQELPFAYINMVSPGSAAEAAGLKAGDELLRFGKVNHTNHNGLMALANELNGETNVVVGRQGERLELVVHGERLGCQILPL